MSTHGSCKARFPATRTKPGSPFLEALETAFRKIASDSCISVDPYHFTKTIGTAVKPSSALRRNSLLARPMILFDGVFF
jgi:hypothetical protein